MFDLSGVGVDVFFEASLKLVDPLEAFFDKVFVMAVRPRALFCC